MISAKVIAVSLIIAATSATSAHAQTTRPAKSVSSAPAAAQPEPATQPLTATTPRGAYHAFLVALDAGDNAAIHAALITTDTAQRRLVDAFANYAQAMYRLRVVSVDAYGKPAAWALVRSDEKVAQLLARVDTLSEQIDGDTAELTDPAASRSVVTLQRVGGVWRLPLTTLFRGLDQEQIDAQADEIHLQATLILELTAEIAQHRYLTADEAAQVLRARFLQPAAPATTPTTLPASPVTSQPSATQPQP